MSVSLKKGNRISLSKEAISNNITLSNVAVGLGWDCNRNLFGGTFDLDAWALMVGEQDKELIYFGSKSDREKSLKHCGDNLTGQGDGDDETILMNLDGVPDRYSYIIVGVTIYGGIAKKQTFQDVENTFIRIYDKYTDIEICKYADQFRGELGNYSSMLFGVLVRTSDRQWEFIAVGSGGNFRNIRDVKSIYSVAAINDILNNNKGNQGGNKKMAVSLSKGAKVSLAKVAEDAGVQSLTKIVVGLGWDVNRYDGGSKFDLDAAAFMTGADGKIREEADFVFYGSTRKTADNKPCDSAESVIHTGDNRTGEGDGDDEQIIVDLTKVPAGVEKISFTVTIDQATERGQSFGQVENAYIHVEDQVSGTDLVRFDLGEDFSVETAIVVAELYRHNGEWKFNPIGSGFQGGLAALCGNFGIEVE